MNICWLGGEKLTNKGYNTNKIEKRKQNDETLRYFLYSRNNICNLNEQLKVVIDMPYCKSSKVKLVGGEKGYQNYV